MAHGIARIGRDRFRTEIELGPHRLVADEPEVLGGAHAGPAPYDLLLASLGACTAITLRMYADRKGWPLQALEVDLQWRQEDDGPRVLRTLRVVGLDDAQRERLADIAERTPVTLTLLSGVAIDTYLV
ncbi:MAG: OsmC family protein [Mitsuaria chitosanitabida]|uniref:OsmC family protein n=1 Tax=Roseateles chitosanitabidus TaxID=65048 RepID=UPI001B268E13|nr:OsmC family protein [Roseateles chitosanitabidus]MBO9687058.1 OsmC family protein [Roseateles chitosanitabidus]